MKKLLIVFMTGAMAACSPEEEEIVQPEQLQTSAVEADNTKNGSNLAINRSCLEAYYPFIGNANDHSGYGNHGTVLGPVLSSDRHGIANNAYYFDGVDDGIEVPDQNQLHLQESFTISAWVRPFSIKTQHMVVKGSGWNGPFAAAYDLSMSATNDIVWRVRPDAQYQELRFDGYTVGRTWYMLTVVYNNGAVGIYKNGKLIKIDKLLKGTFNYNDNPLLIGTRLHLPADTFHGNIDEVRIYCKTLDSQEVLSLYEATK
jgi:hypothetical protein